MEKQRDQPHENAELNFHGIDDNNVDEYSEVHIKWRFIKFYNSWLYVHVTIAPHKLFTSERCMYLIRQFTLATWEIMCISLKQMICVVVLNCSNKKIWHTKNDKRALTASPPRGIMTLPNATDPLVALFGSLKILCIWKNCHGNNEYSWLLLLISNFL